MASIVANYRDIFYYNQAGSPDPGFTAKPPHMLGLSCSRLPILHEIQPQFRGGSVMARTAHLARRPRRRMKSRRTARSAVRVCPTGADTPHNASQRAVVARVKVIKFSDVSKRFILHHERPRSFQEMVVNLFGLRTPSRRGVAMPAPVNEEFWALRDVNFGIYAGEAVGIIGENGSGKSTTLKLISRILEPTAGSVSVRGKVSALLELGTGFHPDLTGRENIFLNGSLLACLVRKCRSATRSIVDFSELHEFIDTPIKHYSSGMVMRLGCGGHQREPRHTPDRRSARGGRRGIPAEVRDHIAGLRRRA